GRVGLPEAVTRRVVHEQLAALERRAHAVAVEQVERADLDAEPVEIVVVEVSADQRGHVVAAPDQLADEPRAHEAVPAGHEHLGHYIPAFVLIAAVASVLPRSQIASPTFCVSATTASTARAIHCRSES